MTAQASELGLVRSSRRLIDLARSHPEVVDAAFAAFVFVFVSLDVVGGTADPGRRPELLTYVLLAGQTLPFAIRRRHAVAAMYLMVGSLSLYWLLDYPAGSDGSGLVAIYSVVLYGTNRKATWMHAAVGILMVAVVGSLLASDFFIDEEGVSVLVVFAVFMLHTLAAVFGAVMHQRRIWLADLQERASRAEAAVETTARLAVAQERTRIAREMHDVVAHEMSIISIQAAAGREIAATDADRARGIFADIEMTGREALVEMRRMLGVLRTDDEHPDGLSPQPTLDDIEDAVAHCVQAGLPTELTVTGQRRRVSPGVELAVFRIVQEALTNTLKHGGDAATASVALDFEPSTLRVAILDSGRGAVSSLGSTGGGNGLIGMSERIDAYSGTFSAGPRPGGGYQVHAELPLSDDLVETIPTSTEATATHQEVG